MTSQAKNIGDLFASLLRTEFSDDEWKTVRERNAAQDCEAICHSHDFCDANEYMAIAFRRVMGRDILPDDGSGMTDADCAIWNAAWMHAKRNYLTKGN